jgi:hypothetical protein
MPKTPPELVGKWSYTSLTHLDNGKPFGPTECYTVGQWTTTFNRDGTWVMQLPNVGDPNQAVHGHYKLHGQDLEMKLVDGERYNNYHFGFEQDGRVLLLTTETLVITASKE